MANREPYCTEEQLVLGDLQLPRGITKAAIIQQAADVMDAYLGQVYQLPITLEPTRPDHLADRLLLQRINVDLAVGGLLLQANAAGEDSHLHAYGKAKYDEAIRELARITAGRTVIEGALPLEPVVTQPNGPIITNKDAGSFVDSFYSSHGSAHSPWESWRINV